MSYLCLANCSKDQWGGALTQAINYSGQDVIAEIWWGYKGNCNFAYADGLIVGLLVPTQYTVVEPNCSGGIFSSCSPSGGTIGGCAYAPLGDTPSIFVEFDPAYYPQENWIPTVNFVVRSASTIYQCGQWNPSISSWPTTTPSSTWYSKVWYHATSRTVDLYWEMNNGWSWSTTVSLSSSIPSIPSGQYYFFLGLATGSGYADWIIYNAKFTLAQPS